MVWIHGDGAIGAGSFFDARRLATVGDVVVVTINYRLGIFGAFGYPGLEGSGAFGLQDQQAALGWVARNAAAFGGDPGNVTVFGESYGGLSTSAHLVAPGSAGLFHRAIIQSGFALMDLPAGGMFPGLPAVAWYGWRAAAEVEGLGAAVAAQLGCADAATALACLRGLPVPELFAHAQPFQPYRVRQPRAARGPGPGAPGRPLPPGAGPLRRHPRRAPAVRRPVPRAGRPTGHRTSSTPGCWPRPSATHADQVQARYPLSAYPSPNLAWATVLTDRMWARSTFEQHRLLAQQVPAYAYEFADRHAPMYLPFPEDFPPGAFHAAEVPYLFPDEPFQAASTPDQRRLSDQMIRYWANFARTGDPNGHDLPPWHAFDDAQPVPHVQSLAPGPAGITPVDYAAEHQLDFWSSLPSDT